MADFARKRDAFFRRVSSKLGQLAQQEGFQMQHHHLFHRPHPSVPGSHEPTPENYTMLQAFEWYVPSDQKHWRRLRLALPGLKATGVDAIWIPPPCKASSPEGNGYDIYDLYDLGEFDTKGSTATKWGTKQELLDLCREANKQGVGIYIDAVLNHKAAADRTERCRAIKVDSNDHTRDVSGVIDIEGWFGFDFPARGNRYSSQKYHWYHFTGTDWNHCGRNDGEKKGVFRVLGDGKRWATDVDHEKGNYDYLMFADLDYSHPEVREDVKNWGVWVAKELGLSGFRFDAIKHFSEDFLEEFIKHLDAELGQDWFLVGEFWKTSLPDLCKYLQKMDHKFNLFDAPLVNNFSRISGDSDLRKVLDGSLTQAEPYNSVTLVMNHDTQPSQALQANIAYWFVPMAYALILLRAEGYPCLFYGDLYGIKGGVEHNWREPSAGGKIPDLALARKLYAYGEQDNGLDNAYWRDDPHCIGWVRRGTWDRPDGCAVLLSNQGPKEKRMYVGELHRGERWTDILGWAQGEVHIGDDGHGIFRVGERSVSVWVNKKAKGRDQFGKFNNRIYQW